MAALSYHCAMPTSGSAPANRRALVIGGGPITVGVLTAAAAVGTLLASLFSGPVANVHRHGLAVSRAISIYGGFVTLFGVVLLDAIAGHPVDWPGG